MKRFLLRSLVLVVATAVVLFGVGIWVAGDAEGSRDQLLAQLDELQTLIEAEDVAVGDVSDWSVHQHAEHLLRANEGILSMIAAGRTPDPVEPKAMLGHVVLMTGTIPRGKGQAPDSTVPRRLSHDDLVAMHARVEEAAQAIDTDGFSDAVVGNHPVFGGLTSTDWLRFAAVHDEHHLKIVADIRARAATSE